MENIEKTNVTLIELKKLEESSNKIGTEIRMLSRAMKKLSDSLLKRETIVLLLHEHSKVSKGDIRAILNGLEKLDDVYCKK